MYGVWYVQYDMLKVKKWYGMLWLWLWVLVWFGKWYGNGVKYGIV